MLIGPNDLTKRVFIVAEIGNNHEGDRAVAELLIEKAAEAGVDAVKFQTFDPAHYINAGDTERLARLQKFRLSAEDFAYLAAAAKRNGLIFFSTPFDLGSVALLDPIVSLFKIASGDNTFYPLLERVAETGKPIILSGGLATIDELRQAADTILSRWRKLKIDPGLALLHCVSSYPTPPEQANIAAIRSLAELGYTVGYSDHTIGVDAAVLAVAAGAQIIEKHFTLDKQFSSFRDHQLSSDPSEMRALVQQIRQAEILLGSGQKVLQQSEVQNYDAIRRSIVAAKNLRKGQVLEWSDITWVRPGGGLPPGSEKLILNRRLHADAPAGTLLIPELFE